METDTNILMVVPNQDFRDEEYQIPWNIFTENGFGVKVAAAEGNECVGTFGTTISPDLTFDNVNTDEFNAIVFVGGSGVQLYFSNDLALGLAKDFHSQEKLTCAICWAPVVLAKAGLVTGKNISVASNGQEEIKKSGGILSPNAVTVDGLIITANGPDSADEFANQISSILQV